MTGSPVLSNPPNSLNPRSRAGKTFVVALWLLGLIAFTQIGLVVHALLRQVRVDISSAAPIAGNQTSAPAAAQQEIPQTSAIEPTPSLPLAAPLAKAYALVPGASADRGRISALIEQARSLRQSGDMQAAIIKLREADTLDDNNPMIMAELASIFEAMGLTDRATELWGKIAAMGASAGALLDLARLKLAPAAGAGTESAASPGIQPGSTLGLIEVRAVDLEDENSKRKLKLRIGLKARTDAQIDVRDVIIQVYFYDLLDGQDIVQTNAEVSSQWATSPADWSDDGIELLEVEYNQPLPSQDEELAEDREYLGYIVRVYYKDQLEDVRADPVRLLELFPPPLEMVN